MLKSYVAENVFRDRTPVLHLRYGIDRYKGVAARHGIICVACSTPNTAGRHVFLPSSFTSSRLSCLERTGPRRQRQPRVTPATHDRAHAGVIRCHWLGRGVPLGACALSRAAKAVTIDRQCSATTFRTCARRTTRRRSSEG